MEEPGGSSQREAAVTCPDCGTPGSVGRFCGRCGKRLVAAPPEGPGAAGDESPSADGDAAGAAGPDTTRSPRVRRRAIRLGLLGLLVLAGVALAVWLRPAGERVTTGPWHHHTGMTSTVAARDLTTELWRTELDLGPEVPPEWRLVGATADLLFLSAHGELTAVDRSSGAPLASHASHLLGLWARGSALPDSAALTLVDGEELVTIDLGTGDVSDRAALDRPMSGGATSVEALPDGDLLVAGADELRRTTRAGRTVWSVPLPSHAGTPQTFLAEDALLLRDHAGLEVRDLATGEVRWQATGLASGPPPVVTGSDLLLVHGGLVVNYDLASGEERWSTAGARPLPEDALGVSGGDLLVSARGGTTLLRYDLTTGERREETPEELARLVSEPDVEGLRFQDGVLLVESSRAIRAVSLDGALLWSAPRTNAVPVTDGQLAILDGSGVSVVDVRSGATREQVSLTLPLIVGPGPPAMIGVTGRAVGLPGGTIVDLGTGELLGRVPDAEAWEPLIPTDDGFLVAGSAPVAIPRSVDAYGRTRWTLEEEVLGSAPLHGSIDGHLIVGGYLPTGPTLSLRDPRTGEEVGDPLAFPSRTVVAPGGDLAVGLREADGLLVGLERDGGQLAERWRVASPGLGRPIVRDDEVVLQHLTSIETRDPEDGSPVLDAPLPVLPRATAFGEDTFVHVSSDDRVLGIDAGTGEVRWSRPAPGPTSGSLIIAGDVAYLGDLTGTVHLLALEDGTSVGSVDVGADPVSEIVVAHGVMLAVSGRDLVAFGPGPERLRLPDLPARATVR